MGRVDPLSDRHGAIAMSARREVLTILDVNGELTVFHRKSSCSGVTTDASCAGRGWTIQSDLATAFNSQRCPVAQDTAAGSDIRFDHVDQVALGDCSPRAPTDPYVRTLPHTVPQIMGSLRDEVPNASRERVPMGSDEVMHRISPSASSGCCCGD